MPGVEPRLDPPALHDCPVCSGTGEVCAVDKPLRDRVVLCEFCDGYGLVEEGLILDFTREMLRERKEGSWLK